MPVSYTHLDVYKRQLLGTDLKITVERAQQTAYLLKLFCIVARHFLI